MRWLLHYDAMMAIIVHEKRTNKLHKYINNSESFMYISKSLSVVSLFMLKLLRQSFFFLLSKFPWLKSHLANFSIYQQDSSESFRISFD